jgi:hypothetical protein
MNGYLLKFCIYKGRKQTKHIKSPLQGSKMFLQVREGYYGKCYIFFDNYFICTRLTKVLLKGIACGSIRQEGKTDSRGIMKTTITRHHICNMTR